MVQNLHQNHFEKLCRFMVGKANQKQQLQYNVIFGHFLALESRMDGYIGFQTILCDYRSRSNLLKSDLAFRFYAPITFQFLDLQAQCDVAWRRFAQPLAELGQSVTWNPNQREKRVNITQKLSRIVRNPGQKQCAMYMTSHKLTQGAVVANFLHQLVILSTHGGYKLVCGMVF